MVTNLVIAAIALLTFSAGTYKRHGYPITMLPVLDLATDDLNRSCQFVTRNMRHHDVLVVTHPAMPVASANAGCLNFQDSACFAGFRIVNGAHTNGTLKLFVDGGFHN